MAKGFHAMAWMERTGGAPESVEALQSAIDVLRVRSPRQVRLLQLHAAALFADLGRSDTLDLIAGVAHTPPLGPSNAVETRLVLARVDARFGGQVNVPDFLTGLDEFAASSHPRRAATMALRFAADLLAIGRDEDAAAVRDWGERSLPPPPMRSHREIELVRDVARRDRDGTVGTGTDGHEDRDGRRSLEGGRMAEVPGVGVVDAVTGPADVRAPLADRSGRVAIRVLQPSLSVTVDGVEVALRDTVAKLLLLLVCNHPAPLHVEQAVDGLWPDVSAEVGRSRLNTVVHRLRKSLDLEATGVRRSGDLLVLDLDGIEVDLVRFRSAMMGSPAEQAVELGAVRGAFCEAQFPYEERLIEARRSFLADWQHRVDALIQAGDLSPDQLSDAARSLGIATGS